MKQALGSTWLALVLAATALVGCRVQTRPVTTPAAVNSTTDVATEYDLVYAITHGRMSARPTPFLVATITAAGLPPAHATALDIGSGNGRNSLYLARHGYQVTAVDLSRVGLDLTRQQAQRDHLPVRTVDQDINTFDFGSRRWDLIVLIDFPFAYRTLLPKIAAGLRPGGLVVVQAVSAKQAGLESPDHMLRYTFMRRRDLTAAFAGFTVLHLHEGEQPTTWGVKAIMITFAARKPENRP